MADELLKYVGDIRLPFSVELGRGLIVATLQEQVSEPIDPATLHVEDKFSTMQDHIYVNVWFATMHGRKASAAIVVKPEVLCKNTEVRFSLDARFIQFLS